MTPTDWHTSDKAKALLAEADAAVTMSDVLTGFGWDAAAEAAQDRHTDLMIELDNLRRAAVNAFACDTVAKVESDEWFDAESEADSEAMSVADAFAAARKARVGSAWLEERGL